MKNPVRAKRALIVGIMTMTLVLGFSIFAVSCGKKDEGKTGKVSLSLKVAS